MSETPPTVVVLGGINGAGKTTSSRRLLADQLHLLSFVNADDIARNFWSRYRPLADEWSVFDNGGHGPVAIATGRGDSEPSVENESLWFRFKEQLDHAS